MKSCFNASCISVAIYQCLCTEEGVYSCGDHLVFHQADTSSPIHPIINIMTKVPFQKKQKIIHKMTELLVFVKDKKKDLFKETNNFIADLIKRSNLVQCNLDRIIETIEKKLKSVLKKEYISTDSKDYLDQILLSDNLNEKLSS